MIITLKGADFSANNIGQIAMPRELNEYTKKAISACGKELTEIQQMALDDFFLALGVDGSNNAMSKMLKIYLPMIANDISKALVNYADSNMTNDKSDLSSSVWTLRNHGLVAIGDGQPINLTTTRILTADNYSCFNFRTEPIEPGQVQINKIVFRGTNNRDLFLGTTETTASDGSSQRFGGTYGREWIKNADGEYVALDYTGFDNILTRFVNVKDSVYQFRKGEGIFIDTPSPITSDMSTETEVTIYVKGMNNCDQNCAEGAILVGEAVDTDVAANIAQKLDALYDVLR